MIRRTISTPEAPAAIGTYSQAVRVGELVFLSGQIPLDPVSMDVVDGGIAAQIERVFENLAAVAGAAEASLDDTVKLTIYLTDMGDFPVVNEIMARYFDEPYPARAAVGVAALPKGVGVEMDAILALGSRS